MYWQVASALLLLTLFGAFSWLIVHARSETIYRPLAIGTFLLSIPALILAFAMTLGTAIPTGWLVFQIPSGQYRILGCKSVPGNGIYVMFDRGDYKIPSFYVLPWDKDLSMKLEQEGCKGILKTDNKDALKLGNWEFSWNVLPPLVTSEETAEKVFPDKILPESAPNRYLPPADD